MSTATIARDQILELLADGETIEAVVLGAWGWDGGDEPKPPAVPPDKRGKVLTWEQAAPMLTTWSFYGGDGAPDCYAVYIWTDRRVFWVTQYDGSTDLNEAPRNPVDCMPDMPGG